MPLLHIETQAGQPIQAGNLRLTPFARATSLRWPNFPGGVIWNRPTAILVQSPDGSEVTLPIHDTTRRQQLTLLGVGLFAALLVRLFFRK